MVGAPLQRDGQARVAVGVAGVAPALVPVARGVGDVTLHTAAPRVVLQPAAQARPLAQQRFVGYLHRGGAHREQPALGERREYAGEVLSILALELCERDAPAHDRAALALPGQSQQKPARKPLVGEVEPAVRVLGHSRDRSAYAAGALVARVSQAPPVAVLPELEQCCGQQRECSGLVFDVRYEPRASVPSWSRLPSAVNRRARQGHGVGCLSPDKTKKGGLRRETHGTGVGGDRGADRPAAWWGSVRIRGRRCRSSPSSARG